MRLPFILIAICIIAWTTSDKLDGTESFKEAAEKLISPRNFTMSVLDDDGLEIGRLTVSPEQEPVDIAHEFCLKHGLTTEALDQILERVCNAPHMRCTRSLPLAYSQNFHAGDQNLGNLEVFVGQEPVDVVHTFAKKHGLGVSVRLNMLSHICASGKIACTRIEPMLYTQEFADGEGRDLGFLSIYEGQEPADVVFEFAKKNDLDAEFRSKILDHVCKNGRVVCNRRSPVVFSQNFADGERQLGLLEIYEGQEPADVVAQFCEDKTLPIGTMVRILSHICNIDGIGCTRMVPRKKPIGSVQLPAE